MSLLKLVLCSTSTRRGVQAALPALCNALGMSSMQQQQPAAAASLLLLQPSRAFHASRSLWAQTPSETERTLSSVLASEIKHEQTAYEQDELVAKGPPAPFKLSSTPGDTAINLTRSFGSGEEVSVDCSVNMQDSLALPFGDGSDDDDEGGLGGEEEDEAADVNFNVTVTRGGSSLVFECVSDGSYVDVRHVSLEPAGRVEDSDTAFTGPVFGELDDAMQEAFRGFIAERGIDENLGEYLRHLVYDKEQQEYVRWLQGVKAFVDAR